MRLSWAAFSLAIYIIISAAFARQLWEFIQRVLGRGNAAIAASAFIFSFAVFIAAGIFKKRSGIRRPVFKFLLLISALFFAWRQPFFTEKFHIIEYGLLGWLACRDLNKGKISFFNMILALAFGSLVGVLDECFQGLLPYRVCELRDMLTNALSVSLGVIFCAAG